MLMGVATLIFLFLIRLRFPTSKSIPSMKERHGLKILKLIRKFEKVDFRPRKIDDMFCVSARISKTSTHFVDLSRF